MTWTSRHGSDSGDEKEQEDDDRNYDDQQYYDDNQLGMHEDIL